MLECFINKCVVLEMTTNSACCFLATLSVWSNTFEKDLKRVQCRVTPVNIQTEEQTQ
jgi:hypothetical protein